MTQNMRRFWLTSLAPLTLIALVGVLVSAVLATRAPAIVPIHYGPNGQPDSWASPVFAWAMLALIQVMLLVLFWWMGKNGMATGSSARVQVGIFGFAIFLIAFISAWIFISARAVEPHLGVLTLLGILLISGAVGALLAWICQPAPAPKKTSYAPTDVHIPADANAAWIGQAKPSRPFAFIVAAVIVLLIGSALATQSWLLWLIAALFALFACTITFFTVTLNREGLSYRSPLGIPRSTIPLKEISQIVPVDIAVGEWGGFGIRHTGSKRGLITRSGKGIRVIHSGDKILEISCDDAEGAAGVFNALRSPGED